MVGRMRRCAGGFTLVELLVAVAIIGVLVSLLFPCLRNANDLARQAVCMTQLHAIGKCTDMYVQGHQWQIPDFVFSFGPGKSGTIVILVVPKRAATSGWNAYPEEVFVCPSDDEPGTVPVRQKDDSIASMPMSYGLNIDFCVQDLLYTDIKGSPSELAFFYDGSMSGKGGGGKNIQGHYHGSLEFAEEAVTYRHPNDSASVLFFDWHVEARSGITEQMIYVTGEPAGQGHKGGKK